MKQFNYLSKMLVFLLLLGSTNAFAITEDFGPIEGDCTIEFDIEATGWWSDLYIKPPADDPNYDTHFNTRIAFHVGILRIFNGDYPDPDGYVSTWQYEIGVKTNMRLHFRFNVDGLGSVVTVEAKKATDNDWTVVFEDFGQAWGYDKIGQMMVAPDNLGITNVRAYEGSPLPLSKTLSIPVARTTPTLDGAKDDIYDLCEQQSIDRWNTNTDQPGVIDGNGDPYSGLGANYWMTYDEDNFYVYGEVQDDEFVDNDMLGISIDLTNSKTFYGETEGGQNANPWVYMGINKAEYDAADKTAGYAMLDNIGQVVINQESGTENWNFEVRIPINSLTTDQTVISQIKAGHEIGFDIGISNRYSDARDLGYEQVYQWSGARNLFYQESTYLGTATLQSLSNKFDLGPHTADCTVEFDIEPKALTADMLYIKPPTSDANYDTYYNTHLEFKDGEVALFNANNPTGLVADNFIYEANTEYNFRISLIFDGDNKFVTVQAKAAGTSQWLVLFDKLEQAYGYANIGQLLVEFSSLGTTNVRSFDGLTLPVKEVTIPEASSAITLDGMKDAMYDDCEKLMMDRWNRNTEQGGVEDVNGEPYAGLGADFWMLYDDANLYVYGEVMDDEFVDLDELGVSIDLMNSQQIYGPSLGAKNDNPWVCMFINKGNYLATFDNDLGYAVISGFAHLVIKQTFGSNNWSFELRIPFASLTTNQSILDQLVAGHEIGFDIGRKNRYDTDGMDKFNEHWYQWSGTRNMFWNESVNLGTVTLKSTATAIEGAEVQNDISLYPNPVDDVLNISSGANIESAAIYSISGQLVKTVLLSGTNVASVNVADLHKGVYIIQVNSNNGQHTKRFVKK
ncbi:T9SS type A sorting domain-containing protein [Carboxylicivirga sp. RSCT41]|uniref:T9SS type A sorting domain-containing protein n=1 Tax=Carboxylicivirga agarovorans TaxID=3417570 RepID=UPI003D334EB6